MVKIFKREKGQAGLDMLMGVVTMLFLLGLIVMVFVYASGELESGIADTTTTAVANETITSVTEVSQDLAYAGYWDVVCSGAVVTNATVGTAVDSANYTVSSACGIVFKGDDTNWNATNLNVTYVATYQTSTDAVLVINKTKDSLSDTVDWFDIIIVMSALVVLILLIVLIIRAIRGTGLVGGA